LLFTGIISISKNLILSSGIGINRLVDIVKMIFKNPEKIDEY